LEEFKKASDAQGKDLNSDINRQKAQSYGDSTSNKILEFWLTNFQIISRRGII